MDANSIESLKANIAAAKAAKATAATPAATPAKMPQQEIADFVRDTLAARGSSLTCGINGRGQAEIS